MSVYEFLVAALADPSLGELQAPATGPLRLYVDPAAPVMMVQWTETPADADDSI